MNSMYEHDIKIKKKKNNFEYVFDARISDDVQGNKPRYFNKYKKIIIYFF